MKKLFVKALFSSSLLATSCFAVEGGWIGGGLGVSDLNISGLGRSAAINLHGGVVLTPEISLGLDINTWAKQVGGLTLSVMPVSLVMNYHFQGSPVHGFYMGAMGSRVQESLSLSTPAGTARVTNSEWGVGGDVGYNFAVSDSFGVGPKFSFVRVLADQNAYNFWSATFNLTYFF